YRNHDLHIRRRSYLLLLLCLHLGRIHLLLLGSHAHLLGLLPHRIHLLPYRPESLCLLLLYHHHSGLLSSHHDHHHILLRRPFHGHESHDRRLFLLPHRILLCRLESCDYLLLFHHNCLVYHHNHLLLPHHRIRRFLGHRGTRLIYRLLLYRLFDYRSLLCPFHRERLDDLLLLRRILADRRSRLLVLRHDLSRILFLSRPWDHHTDPSSETESGRSPVLLLCLRPSSHRPCLGRDICSARTWRGWLLLAMRSLK
ncbi:hypothetical protein PENTCL1PPCAC_243, partial [Pristionchus entomophagus]